MQPSRGTRRDLAPRSSLSGLQGGVRQHIEIPSTHTVRRALQDKLAILQQKCPRTESLDDGWVVTDYQNRMSCSRKRLKPFDAARFEPSVADREDLVEDQDLSHGAKRY